MTDNIKKETERIHQGIVESLSFSEALAKRDAEIERLRSDRRAAADQIDQLTAEIERLHGQLGVFAGDAESIADDAKTLALLIRAALGKRDE